MPVAREVYKSPFCAWQKDGKQCGHAVGQVDGVQGQDVGCAYDEFEDKTCADATGHSRYTLDSTSGRTQCAGWTATTAEDCWAHCENNDQLGDCSNPECVASEFVSGTGTCHLFSSCDAHEASAGATLRDGTTRMHLRCAMDGSEHHVCPQGKQSPPGAPAYVRVD